MYENVHTLELILQELQRVVKMPQFLCLLTCEVPLAAAAGVERLNLFLSAFQSLGLQMSAGSSRDIHSGHNHSFCQLCPKGQSISRKRCLFLASGFCIVGTRFGPHMTTVSFQSVEKPMTCSRHVDTSKVMPGFGIAAAKKAVGIHSGC